ncbi:MAG: hydroxylase, partial [bacterium]|nr:hydroxylase [bacterium]
MIVAGAFSPPAEVSPVEGGYRLNGHWAFGSGCQYASWFIGPAVVMDGDQPKLADSGDPVQAVITFRAKDVEIRDTWHALGMRGTGSHDFVAEDVFIPERWVTPLVPLTDPGKAHEGPLYRLALWPAVGVLAPPALGVARATIDELVELAKRKTPRYTRSKLRERQVAQAQVAEAEASLGAGRAYLHEAFGEAFEAVSSGHRLPQEQKIKMQLATTYAIQSAAKAVDLVHAA